MDSKKVLSAFQFLSSRITKLNIRNNIVVFNPAQSGLSKNIQVDYCLKDVESREECLFGLVCLTVDAKIKDGKKLLTSIHLEIEGAFASNPGGELDAFREMLSINGCATLYSIARAVVMSTTSQCYGSGQVSLPMINLFKLNEEKKKEG